MHGMNDKERLMGFVIMEFFSDTFLTAVCFMSEKRQMNGMSSLLVNVSTAWCKTVVTTVH